jgi:hypothetical protein
MFMTTIGDMAIGTIIGMETIGVGTIIMAQIGVGVGIVGLDQAGI